MRPSRNARREHGISSTRIRASPDMLATTVRRVSPGQSDLGRDTAALPLQADATRRLLAAYRRIERSGDLGLQTGRSTGQPLQRAEHVHPGLIDTGPRAACQRLNPGLDHPRVESPGTRHPRIERVFEHTCMATAHQAPSRRWRQALCGQAARLAG